MNEYLYYLARVVELYPGLACEHGREAVMPSGIAQFLPTGVGCFLPGRILSRSCRCYAEWQISASMMPC
jgi:hypothetical protein